MYQALPREDSSKIVYTLLIAFATLILKILKMKKDNRIHLGIGCDETFPL